MERGSKSEIIKPFVVASLAWSVLGSILSWKLAKGGANVASLEWFFGLSALCLLDLFTLTKVLAVASSLMADSPEKKAADSIQALAWGMLKLACLGIFAVVFFVARSIPVPALILGVGTMLVVPLFGGLVWSQRVLRHA